jgi:phosphomethylpyrimidine synthase
MFWGIFMFWALPADSNIVRAMDRRESDILMASQAEGIDPDLLRKGLASGEIVLPRNRKRGSIKPVAIGKGLRTKVNANLGTSEDRADLRFELEKLSVAVDAGADTVMDLSTGGDIDIIRSAILEESAVPVGTVPIYQAWVECIRRERTLVETTADEMLEAVQRHIEDGVDFITVHCGVTLRSVEILSKEARVTDVVSRGGTFLFEWMSHNRRENPLYERYDEILDMARAHDVTLSLGDGMRPGCIADASDKAQIDELVTLGELVDRARAKGVQAMVEGPGHVPVDQVEANVLMEKTICKGAPFYVLGPIVTDVCPGYDHITGAIGGAIAAAAGADFLCYVTASEHLRLPDLEDVREGVMTARIAAHAGDIAKSVAGARDWDLRMSQMRKRLDWTGMLSLALDPEKARRLRTSSPSSIEDVCSMCGEFCSLKNLRSTLKQE